MPGRPFDEVRAALASRLGIEASATLDGFTAAFDKHMRSQRLAGAIAQRLGLPCDAGDGDIVAAVNSRLDTRAVAAGLPAGSRWPEIEAAEKRKRESAAAPAPSSVAAVQSSPARSSGAGWRDAYDEALADIILPGDPDLAPAEAAALDLMATTGSPEGVVEQANASKPGKS